MRAQLRRFSRVFVFVFLFNLICSSSLVYGAEGTSVDAVKFISVGSPEISTMVKQMQQKGYSDILFYESGTGIVRFSNRNYYALSTKEKTDFMDTLLSLIRNSGLAVQTRNKLYNFIEDQDGTTAAAVKYLSSDTSTDFVTAVTWLKPFSGAIGTVLGVLALLIFLMMGVSLVTDTAYIVLPGFGFFVDRISDRVFKLERPFGVSIEAYRAVKEAEESDIYRSPMAIYLGRRTKVIMIVSICLLYLVSGQIYDLMSWVIDSFGGIIKF